MMYMSFLQEVKIIKLGYIDLAHFKLSGSMHCLFSVPIF